MAAASRPRGRPAAARSASVRPMPRKAVAPNHALPGFGKGGGMGLLVVLVVLLAVAVAGVVFFMMTV